MFTSQDIDGIRYYSGQPDCSAGYSWVLALLRDTTAAWLSDPTQFNSRIKGNIGEFVAFHLVNPRQPLGSGWYAFYSNTDNPLSRISGAGLDMCFIYLDADTTGAKDRLYIQEVKTTGSAKLDYADMLVQDHLKLTSVDPSLNLQARIRAIKARMRDLYVADAATLKRIQEIANPDPAKCDKVMLLPTLVHEKKNADPATKLAKVRKEIADQDWQLHLIYPISISISRLDDGFASLAQNVPFKP
ncbi:hypothetical protein ABT364_24960 [Massilia sp. SR12]